MAKLRKTAIPTQEALPTATLAKAGSRRGELLAGAAIAAGTAMIAAVRKVVNAHRTTDDSPSVPPFSEVRGPHCLSVAERHQFGDEAVLLDDKVEHILACPACLTWLSTVRPNPPAFERLADSVRGQMLAAVAHVSDPSAHSIHDAAANEEAAWARIRDAVKRQIAAAAPQPTSGENAPPFAKV